MRASSLRQPKSVFCRSSLVAALALALSPMAASAATLSFQVTNNADFGAGSLRQAINDVNSQVTCGTDDMAVNFTGGPFVIQPGSSLPPITCARTTINANQDSGNVISGAAYIGGTWHEASLYEILQILSVSAFEKTPVQQGFHFSGAG